MKTTSLATCLALTLTLLMACGPARGEEKRVAKDTAKKPPIERRQITVEGRPAFIISPSKKLAGLTPAPSRMVKPPGVAESPVHFECLYHQTVTLPGNRPDMVHHVVFGKVIGIHIEDEFITDEGLVDVLKLRPIARLGYKDYTSVESVFSMNKRTLEDTIAPAATQAAE